MIGPISQIKIFDELSKKETNSSISNEEIKNIITQLETDVEDKTCFHKNYSCIDVKFMPALITQENNKHPEMNIKLFLSLNKFSTEIKNFIEQGVESSRLIINMGEDGIHFSVIDYRYINGKTSLILFEPANFNSMGPALLALRTKMAIKRDQLSDCHFSMVEMDIQRSSSECGIFSLALAKKLYAERNSMLKIHEDNIKGILGDSETPIPHDKLDPYLPVTFYKHTQGKRRLNEYLSTNTQVIGTVINKKNETILNRLNKNISFINGRELSVSAHKKRITEYKKLLKP